MPIAAVMVLVPALVLLLGIARAHPTPKRIEPATPTNDTNELADAA